MTGFEVQRAIRATPEQVWKILTNAQSLVDGGLGVIRLEGTIALGAKLRLWSEVSPNRAFSLRVAELTPPRTMVWSGGMPLGLFTGVRTFTLTPDHNGTLFRMREEFSGLMAPLILRSMPDLTPSFEKFAEGLKALSEAAR